MTLKHLVAALGGLFLGLSAASAALAADASDASPGAVDMQLRPSLPAPVRELKPVGDVESEIADAAKLYNLDPALVRAVALQESGLRHEARSRRGAVGVMQLMPQTGRELGYDVKDLRGNIRAGAAYLSTMMESFGGDVSKALAAYNAGPGAVQRYGGIPPFRETRNYVASITAKLAVGAATVATQPLSTTVAQLGARAVQGAAQAAAQAAGPGMGLGALSDMDRLVARVTGHE